MTVNKYYLKFIRVWALITAFWWLAPLWSVSVLDTEISMRLLINTFVTVCSSSHVKPLSFVRGCFRAIFQISDSSFCIFLWHSLCFHQQAMDYYWLLISRGVENGWSDSGFYCRLSPQSQISISCDSGRIRWTLPKAVVARRCYIAQTTTNVRILIHMI